MEGQVGCVLCWDDVEGQVGCVLCWNDVLSFQELFWYGDQTSSAFWKILSESKLGFKPCKSCRMVHKHLESCMSLCLFLHIFAFSFVNPSLLKNINNI